jgi:hypothetical protein
MFLSFFSVSDAYDLFRYGPIISWLLIDRVFSW